MFNDPNLQNVLNKYKNNICEKIRKLDQISEDIKKLEILLRRSAVQAGCKLNLPEGVIIWNGKRICFVLPDKSAVHLIEMPSNIRLIAYPYFSEFLELN